MDAGKLMTPFLKSVERNTDGMWTANGIASRFLEKKWEAWLVLNGDDCVGLFATEITTDDSGRLLCGVRFLNGHDYKSWQHLYPEVELWAKNLGCYKMVNTNAPGHMRRALRDYKTTHYVTEKVL